MMKIECIDPRESAEYDVIFIHGLEGKPNSTWKGSENFDWPHKLSERFTEAQVWIVEYDSSATITGPTNGNNNSEKLAALFAEHLAGKDLGIKRPFFLICHSFGGLLAKRVLLHLEKQNPRRDVGLAGILFLGTPHFGSDLAHVLIAISGVLDPLKQLKEIGGLLADRKWMAALQSIGTLPTDLKELTQDKASALVKELSDWVGLVELNAAFQIYLLKRAESSPFVIKNYIETKAVAFKRRIVEENRAESYLYRNLHGDKVDPVRLQYDHMTICKPDNEKHPAWVGFEALRNDFHENLSGFSKILSEIQARDMPYLYPVYCELESRPELALELRRTWVGDTANSSAAAGDDRKALLRKLIGLNSWAEFETFAIAAKKAAVGLQSVQKVEHLESLDRLVHTALAIAAFHELPNRRSYKGEPMLIKVPFSPDADEINDIAMEIVRSVEHGLAIKLRAESRTDGKIPNVRTASTSIPVDLLSTVISKDENAGNFLGNLLNEAREIALLDSEKLRVLSQGLSEKTGLRPISEYQADSTKTFIEGLPDGRKKVVVDARSGSDTSGTAAKLEAALTESQLASHLLIVEGDSGANQTTIKPGVAQALRMYYQERSSIH